MNCQFLIFSVEDYLEAVNGTCEAYSKFQQCTKPLLQSANQCRPPNLQYLQSISLVCSEEVLKELHLLAPCIVSAAQDPAVLECMQKVIKEVQPLLADDEFGAESLLCEMTQKLNNRCLKLKLHKCDANALEFMERLAAEVVHRATGYRCDLSHGGAMPNTNVSIEFSHNRTGSKSFFTTE